MSLHDNATATKDRHALPIAWEVWPDGLFEDERPAEYEAHVRATGPMYACPPWCSSTHHPRAGIAEGALVHEVDLPGVSAPGLGFWADVSQSLGADAPEIWANLELRRGMSSADARQIAAALLAAADALDDITG